MTDEALLRCIRPRPRSFCLAPLRSSRTAPMGECPAWIVADEAHFDAEMQTLSAEGLAACLTQLGRPDCASELARAQSKHWSKAARLSKVRVVTRKMQRALESIRQERLTAAEQEQAHFDTEDEQEPTAGAANSGGAGGAGGVPPRDQPKSPFLDPQPFPTRLASPHDSQWQRPGAHTGPV